MIGTRCDVDVCSTTSLIFFILPDFCSVFLSGLYCVLFLCRFVIILVLFPLYQWISDILSLNTTKMLLYNPLNQNWMKFHRWNFSKTINGTEWDNVKQTTFKKVRSRDVTASKSSHKFNNQKNIQIIRKRFAFITFETFEIYKTLNLRTQQHQSRSCISKTKLMKSNNFSLCDIN